MSASGKDSASASPIPLDAPVITTRESGVGKGDGHCGVSSLTEAAGSGFERGNRTARTWSSRSA